MKKSAIPFVDEYSKYANNMILRDSFDSANYLNDNVRFEKSMSMQFNIPNDWSYDQKLSQLNKYKQKPHLNPENIEQFVRTFSSESLSSHKTSLPSRKRIRRSYIKSDQSFESDLSFEIKGSTKGNNRINCSLLNASGVINLSGEFE
ncbi:Hypothetical_protein [Hexamita inflata]|uniref:Hypothetical_protein n=1 Tax=Hexamita inflata TaxID=28002 RepID=A0AA86PWB1_9EUKA|nr:Hypothetical protein HINF_LOCUS32498 [Hexamita inflata]